MLVHFFVLSRRAIRKALELSYHDPSLIDDELIDAYRSRLLVEGVDDAYYGLMAPLDLPSPHVDLTSLDIPTLVLWGDDDRLIPFETVEPYVRKLPRVEVALLDDCGHSPMEERPEALLAHLFPFLERHRGRQQHRMLSTASRVAWRSDWLTIRPEPLGHGPPVGRALPADGAPTARSLHLALAESWLSGKMPI